MSLVEYYSSCAFKKLPPRSADKIVKDRETKTHDANVRKTVNARDKHACFYPRCRATAFHKHHKIYASRGGKFVSENVVSGCATHHRWVHDGLITLHGHPDHPPIGVRLTTIGAAAKIRIPERQVA